MPKRTNTFQEVVALLHQHAAGDASLEESAMLVNRVTGELREVDVVIRSEIAGHEMVLGIEATMKKGSSPWVEQMIGKHEELPTDRLVLVADRGFSGPARRYAAKKGVALIEPTDLSGDDPVFKIVNKLEHVWPKGLALAPTALYARLEQPGGERLLHGPMPLDVALFLENGSSVGTVLDIVQWLMRDEFPRLASMVGLADATDDRREHFNLRLGLESMPFTYVLKGAERSLYLRWAADSRLDRIIELEFQGDLAIDVAEVRLTHRRFDKTMAAYGEAEIYNRPALIVISEDEEGGKASVRLRPPAADADQTPGGYQTADRETAENDLA